MTYTQHKDVKIIEIVNYVKTASYIVTIKLLSTTGQAH